MFTVPLPFTFGFLLLLVPSTESSLVNQLRELLLD
jgi:hypothetical protein